MEVLESGSSARSQFATGNGLERAVELDSDFHCLRQSGPKCSGKKVS